MGLQRLYVFSGYLSSTSLHLTTYTTDGTGEASNNNLFKSFSFTFNISNRSGLWCPFSYIRKSKLPISLLFTNGNIYILYLSLSWRPSLASGTHEQDSHTETQRFTCDSVNPVPMEVGEKIGKERSVWFKFKMSHLCMF